MRKILFFLIFSVFISFSSSMAFQPEVEITASELMIDEQPMAVSPEWAIEKTFIYHETWPDREVTRIIKGPIQGSEVLFWYIAPHVPDYNILPEVIERT